MNDGKNVFGQQVKNKKVTYKNIRKIATGQGDDYTTGCLLDYAYFRDKMIVIDLSKQQALDADPRAIQQINFTREEAKEAKETVSDFSQGTVKVLYICYRII